MAIVKRMYPKGKSSFVEYFEAENKKRAERMIAAYEKKIKESLKNQNKKATATNNG